MAGFAGRRPPHHASSFGDREAAESALEALLRPRQHEIDRWLGAAQRRICFAGDTGRAAGRVANAFGQVWETSWVRAVLEQDPAAPDGWWLVTGYPTPAPSGEPITSVATPALAHLTGAYFHQDWYEDLGDCDHVIARFVADSPSLAPLLPAEVAALVTDVPDPLWLQVHLLDLGWEFRAYPEEGGPVAWLRHVAELVS